MEQLVSVLGGLDFFYFASPKTPRTLSDFEALRRQKIELLRESVNLRGRGSHILYASTVIDHGLSQLDGRDLILSVMQGTGRSPIRDQDNVCTIRV